LDFWLGVVIGLHVGYLEAAVITWLYLRARKGSRDEG